jgi:hypothetical protein
MSAEDKLAVAETVYRYALGVDTRDWPLYRAQFADRVRVDFSSSFGRPVVEVAADDWVAGVRPQFEGLHASNHMMSNPLVELTGDTARIRMYVQATHVLDADDPTSSYTIGGYYDDELVADDDRWVLTAVKLIVLWTAGDPGIMDAALSRGRETAS